MSPIIYGGPPIWPLQNPSKDETPHEPLDIGSHDLETVIRPDVIPADAKEIAKEYLEKAGKDRISGRQLDRAAKKVVEIATLQPGEGTNVIDYDEAVGSGLIEPYDLSVRSDRIAMAGIMAQDIMSDRVRQGIKSPNVSIETVTRPE